MPHSPRGQMTRAVAVLLVNLLALAAAQPAAADVPNATYNSSPLIGTAVDRALSLSPRTPGVRAAPLLDGVS